MAWVWVMIWAVTIYLSMLGIERASKRAYRRGCRDGLKRGYNKCYRDLMEHSADRDALVEHAELIIEQAEKDEAMWAHYVQSAGKINPWYRSDN